MKQSAQSQRNNKEKKQELIAASDKPGHYNLDGVPFNSMRGGAFEAKDPAKDPAIEGELGRPTDIGLKFEDRKRVAQGLGVLLADTYALYLKTQNFHWNVVGPNFGSLHSLFEKQYEELAENVDQIAERIRALGFPTPATFSIFQSTTSVKEERGTPPAERMLESLIEGHEVVIRTVNQINAVAEQCHDLPTMDMMCALSASHQKAAWMLKSSMKEAEQALTAELGRKVS